MAALTTPAHSEELTADDVQALIEQGKYEEALPIAKQIADSLQDATGLERIVYALRLEDVAELHIRLGEYDRAESVLLQILEIRGSESGEENIGYVTALQGLAGLYEVMGEEEKAGLSYVQVVRLWRKILNKASSKSATQSYVNSLVRLGKLYRRQGRYQDSLPVFKEAAERTGQIWGYQHQHYATRLNELGGVYKDIGDYSEADLTYGTALDVYRASLGADHLHYAICLGNKAYMHLKAGDYQLGEALLNEKIEIVRGLPATSRKHAFVVRDLNTLASIYLQADAYGQAERCLDEAMELYDRLLGSEHPAHPETLLCRVYLYIDTARYEEANALLDGLLNIPGEEFEGNDVEYAEVLNAAGMLRSIMGDYEQSERFYKQAIDASEDDKYLAYLSNLAALYQDRGLYERAEHLFRTAVETNRDLYGRQHPLHAEHLHKLGAIRRMLGDYSGAEPLFLEALEIKRNVWGEEHSSYANTLNSLAVLYQSVGAYGKAEERYKEAVEVALKVYGEAHPVYARQVDNLAGLYAELGLYERAAGLRLEAIEALKRTLGPEHPDVANAMRGFANLRSNLGDYELARDVYEAAAHIQRKSLGDDHPELATTLNNLAMATSNLGNGAAAASLYKEALRINHRAFGEKSEHYATNLGNLAGLYEAMDDRVRAESLYKQALEIELAVLGADHPSYGVTAHNYGGFLRRSGRFEQALAQYERALAAFEATRSNIFMEEHRRGYERAQDISYDIIAATYLAAGDPVGAFETIERGRAKSLMDLFGTQLARGRMTDVAEVQALDRRINQLRGTQPIHNVESLNIRSTRALLEVDAAASSLLERRRALVEAKAEANPELRDLVTVSPATLQEVQQLLDPGVALIEYSHAGAIRVDDDVVNELLIFKVTADAFKVYEVPVPVDKLQQTVNSFVDAVRNKEHDAQELAALSKTLHRWLIEPVRGLDDYDTMVVVPWGALNYVPFAALTPEGGEPLGMTNKLVVTSSAGVHRYLKPKRAAHHQWLYAMGNPANHLAPLRWAEQETAAVAKLFRIADVRTASSATETAVKAGIGDADVVHFACHAVLNEHAPQLSYLALTPDDENDGRLEMHEVFGLDWEGVSLVTLAACSTARGALGPGDDIMGLTRGFMYAGAPSVLCTLWDVDDESTRVFMEHFYRAYTSGKTKPESLQYAQSELRKSEEWSHPYYWAPFVLWGDWM